MGCYVLYDEPANEDKKYCCFMERKPWITLPWEQEPVPSDACVIAGAIGIMRQFLHDPGAGPGAVSRGLMSPR